MPDCQGEAYEKDDATRKLRRNGLQVEQVRDQEQRALSRSQSFFDAGAGSSGGARHPASTEPLLACEVKSRCADQVKDGDGFKAERSSVRQAEDL